MVARSRQGSSLCRDNVLFFVVTMSQQRVPCRTETTKAGGQGCDRSLVEAKEFQVTTGNFSVATGFSRSCVATGFLCHDSVWLRPKDLVLRHSILCRDRVGQGQKFYVATKYFYVTTAFGLEQGSCVVT